MLSASMVNNYIKQFSQAGLIKINGKTNRTRSYHLTDFGEKHLIEALLSYSAEIVQLYGSVKQEISRILNGFYEDGIRTVALFGAAETAEIVYSAIKETHLVVIGVVDNDLVKQGKLFNGIIIQDPDQLNVIKPDGVIITSFARQEEIEKDIQKAMGRTVKIKKLSSI